MKILHRNREPALHSIYDENGYTLAKRSSAGLLSLLLISGCTGGNSAHNPFSGAITTSPVPAGSAHRSPGDSGVMVTFDSRASAHTKPGFTNIIYVYHGPGNSDADRQQAGTFKDGQTATGLCVTLGRTVNADTAVGEKPGKSDEWVLLSMGAFATELYLQKNSALDGLPDC